MTVIKLHIADFNLLVEWDTSMVFPYHFDKYGDHQKSNVVVCDVPRVLQTEKIAVGCLVKRGYAIHELYRQNVNQETLFF